MANDEELYRQYLCGDETGLEPLMKKYGDPLTLYINGYLHDVHESEDLMIEVFSYLFTKKPRIRDDGLKAYLYKAARHMALRHKSRRRLFFSLDALTEEQDGTQGDIPKTTGNDNGQSHVEEHQPVSPDTPENAEQQITEEQNREEQATGEQITEEQAGGGQTTGVPTTEDTGEEQKSTEENSPADNSPVDNIPADNGSNPDDSGNLQSEDNSHSGGWIPVLGVSAGALVIGSGLYLGFRKWKK